MKLTTALLIGLACTGCAENAHAYCASGNPLDTRCNPSDFLNRSWGSTTYYAQNEAFRRQVILSCMYPPRYPSPPTPQAWCTAAYRAQTLQQQGRLY